jgi:DNA-binding NarL/FixJ family response regulator
MTTEENRCVLLADRHLGLVEGMRGLLQTIFDVVVMVSDEASLCESARRMHVTLAIVDLSLTRNHGLEFIRRIRRLFPELKLIALSVHRDKHVQEAVIAAGADGLVLKQFIATDLLPAVGSVLAGNSYLPVLKSNR